MQHAFMLSSRRERCFGTWRIGKISVQLLSAGQARGNVPTKASSLLGTPWEFYSVYMLFLCNLLGQLTLSYTRDDLGWTEPTFLNAIAAVY